VDALVLKTALAVVTPWGKGWLKPALVVGALAVGPPVCSVAAGPWVAGVVPQPNSNPVNSSLAARFM
jgi:hypothetical protein